MPSRSQRHVYERDGVDSAGEIEDTSSLAHANIASIAGNQTLLTATIALSGQYDANDKLTVHVETYGKSPAGVITTAAGTNAVASKITLSQTWDVYDTVTVHVTSATLDDDFSYTPGGDETPTQVATGLALVLENGAKITSSGVGAEVRTLSDGGETAHTLSDLRVVRAAISDRDYTYEPGQNRTPAQAATAFAAIINADATVSSTATSNVISANAVAPAEEVQLSNLRVTAVPHIVIDKALGNTTVPAVLHMKGLWDGTSKATVHAVAAGGTASADFTYIPNGTKTLAQMATGLAAVLNAHADLVASAVYDKVHVTVTGVGVTGVTLSAAAATAAPQASITDATGTDAAASTIALSGTWNTTTKIKVHVVSATLDGDYNYTPGGVETPTQVATGFAAVLAAANKLASVGAGPIVQTLSDAGETAHTLSALAITQA